MVCVRCPGVLLLRGWASHELAVASWAYLLLRDHFHALVLLMHLRAEVSLVSLAHQPLMLVFLSRQPLPLRQPLPPVSLTRQLHVLVHWLQQTHMLVLLPCELRLLVLLLGQLRVVVLLSWLFRWCPWLVLLWVCVSISCCHDLVRLSEFFFSSLT